MKKDIQKPRYLEALVGTTLPYALSAYAKWVAPTTNEFVKGSLADILVPWGLYNLSSSMGSTSLFNASYPLAIYFTYETLQGFDCIPGVFDPWDYAAYTLGVGLGFATEKIADRFRKK